MEIIVFLLFLEMRADAGASAEEINFAEDIEPELHLHKDSNDEDDNLYERKMAEKFSSFAQTSVEPESSFQEEMLNYERQFMSQRIDSKMSVLKFWEEKEAQFPRLHKIALIVLAGAGTQVSVERLFSGLKFLLNDHRSMLSSQNIEDILLIRGNFEYLDDKFFRKIAHTE